MARPLRIEYENAVYHITSRGNGRNNIFLDDDDRKKILSVLHSVVKRYNWICHTYCLMSNHYHLVIETPEGNLSRGMRQLNGAYTQAFNAKHNCVGHLFQGRYKAILIEKESHLLEVCRYVVLNPIRSKMIADLEEWKWSSYFAMIGKIKATNFLYTDWILAQFAKEIDIAQKKYEKFVIEGITADNPFKKVTGQIFLGGEEFIANISNILSENVKAVGFKEIPKAQRYAFRPELCLLFTEDNIKNKSWRNKQIYKANDCYGYTLKEIANFLGIHYSTVSKVILTQNLDTQK